MEKTKPNSEQAENAQDLVAKVRENKKGIVGLAVAVLVVLVAVMGWYLIAQNGSQKADEAIGRADVELNDSIATELYAQAAQCGYRSGNRAKAEMGIRLFQEGNFEEAARYLGECSLDDNIASAGVRSLEGDCYVNLDKYDEALDCYDVAISEADNNPAIVPFILVKKANVYRAQENYSEEAEAYKEILDDYPTYNAGQVDIRALYERAFVAASAQ